MSLLVVPLELLHETRIRLDDGAALLKDLDCLVGTAVEVGHDESGRNRCRARHALDAMNEDLAAVSDRVSNECRGLLEVLRNVLLRAVEERDVQVRELLRISWNNAHHASHDVCDPSLLELLHVMCCVDISNINIGVHLMSVELLAKRAVLHRLAEESAIKHVERVISHERLEGPLKDW